MMGKAIDLKNLTDRARGMLVGLAVGDALGAPVEFGCTSESIAGDIARIGEYHQNYVVPAGVWTDDTSMALCLADSLLECGGYDSGDVMEKYYDWNANGYRSYYNMGFGIGLQVERALDDYSRNPGKVPKDAPRGESAGNGSIMRLAPALIAAAGSSSLEDAVRLAWVSGRETHYSEVAETGTEVFANLLYRALHGANKAEIARLDNLYFTSGTLSECWADHSWLVEGRIHSNGECLRDLGGYVIDAITIALWAFLRTDSFETGMLEVLKLGGDTDTNGAIYGQLAGAYYGYKAIPQKWLDGLYLHTEIVELADKLLALEECPILETRFEEDEV